MITIRRASLQGDPAEAFIGDTLVRSYSDAANGGRDGLKARELAHSLFAELTEPIARKMMSGWLRARITEGARLWLAFVPDDADPMFVGWICASPGVLHYVYVKRNFRRKRIASSLLHDVIAHGFDAPRPLSSCSVMTWPWVERWLGRNGVNYQPTAKEEHEQARQAG